MNMKLALKFFVFLILFPFLFFLLLFPLFGIFIVLFVLLFALFLPFFIASGSAAASSASGRRGRSGAGLSGSAGAHRIVPGVQIAAQGTVVDFVIPSLFVLFLGLHLGETAVLLGQRTRMQPESGQLQLIQRQELLAANRRFIDNAPQRTVILAARTVDHPGHVGQERGQVVLHLLGGQLVVGMLQALHLHQVGRARSLVIRDGLLSEQIKRGSLLQGNGHLEAARTGVDLGRSVRRGRGIRFRRVLLQQ